MGILGSFKNLMRSKASKVAPPPVEGSRVAALPKWHSQLVLICEKCGKKLDSEKKLSLEFKDGIKKKMIHAGLWGPVRFVTSSCLDLCPEGKVAVAFTGDSGQPSEVLAIDPAQDQDFIFQKISERSRTQLP